MSHLEKLRLTERTSTNLERSHRLPHDCTKKDIRQILAGIDCRKNLTISLTAEQNLCFPFDRASSLQDP